MRRLLWTLPVAFFFLNPGFACGPAEPQYQYGAEEMRAAVEGTWSFSIVPGGATTPVKITVKVEQAASAPAAQALAPARSFFRAAHACGSRTLVKSAGACTDSSVMPLAVTFLSGDPSLANAPLSGTFMIYSTEFVTVETSLELVLGPYRVHSQLTPDGVPLMAAASTTDYTAASLTVIAHD